MAELEPVSESWTRALCVVAHPDDLEFGAAAAVARWTDQGKTVVYAMVTSGEAGIDGLAPDEARGVREAEQVESARIVGVDTVEFLGLPDGVLEYGVGLRRAICAVVRKHRPEIVITNNFRDTWGGVALNQADHIATGKATLDAARDAGDRWIFNEQLVDGIEPWGGVGRSGRPARRTAGTGSRPRRPSLAVSPRSPPTRPTSTASAGRTSIPRSSSRAVRGRPGPGSAYRWRRASRCSPSAGAMTASSLFVSCDRLRTRNGCLTNCQRLGVPLVLFEHAF